MKPQNKRMHLTVGRPAAANAGLRSHPPAGDAQRSAHQESAEEHA